MLVGKRQGGQLNGSMEYVFEVHQILKNQGRWSENVWWMGKSRSPSRSQFPVSKPNILTPRATRYAAASFVRYDFPFVYKRTASQSESMHETFSTVMSQSSEQSKTQAVAKKRETGISSKDEPSGNR